MREGTIVDATLIAASPSTKNQDRNAIRKCIIEEGQSLALRDEGAHRRGRVIGPGTPLIGTPGNVADVTQAQALLHGDEIAVLGDAGYQGVEKREENRGKSVTWHVAMKRSKRKALPTDNSVVRWKSWSI